MRPLLTYRKMELCKTTAMINTVKILTTGSKGENCIWK